MSYRALDSYDTVQVLGPHLQYPAQVFTIKTGGGWVLIRTVPKGDTGVQTRHELLSSLADGVDSLVGAGYAIAASGAQAVDASNLLYDVVRFTVEYTPAEPTGGTITTDVDIRVEFVSFTATGGPGASAENQARDMLTAAMDELKTLASG